MGSWWSRWMLRGNGGGGTRPEAPRGDGGEGRGGEGSRERMRIVRPSFLNSDKIMILVEPPLAVLIFYSKRHFSQTNGIVWMHLTGSRMGICFPELRITGHTLATRLQNSREQSDSVAVGQKKIYPFQWSRETEQHHALPGRGKIKCGGILQSTRNGNGRFSDTGSNPQFRGVRMSAIK